MSHPSSHAGRSRNRVISSALLAVFFASGVSALLYQVIWQRMLAIFSGADVFSVTIIVSAFMGGLGCGNLVGGYVADRLSRWHCLILFAVAELAVGLFALVSKIFYYDFLYGRHSALTQSIPLLATVLFLSVLWPTFFMGLSLPLLARGLTGAIQEAARTIGSLYGYNTLGAAAGALCTTWILLRHFGFESCLQIGAVINLACAASAIPLGLALRPGPDSGRQRGVTGPDDAARRWSPVSAAVFGLPQWLLLYALSGAVALSFEITWFRVLGVMLKSTSFTFGTLLTIFLSGVASGSIAGARWLARDARDPVGRFLLLQAGIGIYAAVSLSLLVWTVDGVQSLAPLWNFFGGLEPVPVGEAIADLAVNPLVFLGSSSPARMLVALYALLPVLLIGPPTFFMGLSFPCLQKAVQTDAAFLGRRVGWLQSANIGGSLLGSVLTGFVLLPWLGTSGTFRVLTGATGIFAFLWLRVRQRSETPRGLAPPAVGLAAILLALAVVPPGDVFWSKLHGLAPSRVLYREGKAGVTVMRPARRERDGFVLMAGGLGLSWIPYGKMHTVLGTVPLMLHPDPKRIAVIGLGSGDTAYAFAGRPEVEEVVVIEIVGSEFDLLRAFDTRRHYPALRSFLTDSRFRFVIGDGRTYIRGDQQKFDLIEADALRPSSAYSGNLYSLEYFKLLRENLKPGGMAVTWVPTRRVLRTFLRSFPHVLVLENEALLTGSMAIGSEAPIRYDREALLAALEAPFVRAHYQRARIDIHDLISRNLAKWTTLLVGPDDDRSQLNDVNSDLFAKDEFMVAESIP